MQVTMSKRILTIIPIIAFATTITISNGVTRTIEHHRAVTANSTLATDEIMNGSYKTMFESLNSISTR